MESARAPLWIALRRLVESPRGNAPPPWMGRWLFAAALYNLLWGALVVLWPGLWFLLLKLPAPNYPGIWQCVGMVVGVYGVGYAFAAADPVRHWPIVLVGLLGKVLGPIGFVSQAAAGLLPWRLGWIIVFNDLLWWIPFMLIVKAFAPHELALCRERWRRARRST